MCIEVGSVYIYLKQLDKAEVYLQKFKPKQKDTE
jgi:hypothetical protein